MAVRIGFIFSEQPTGAFIVGADIHSKLKVTQRLMIAKNDSIWLISGSMQSHSRFARTPLVLTSPDPRVVIPKLGQNVNYGRIRTSIMHGQFDQNIIGRLFGILDLAIEVGVFFECNRVKDLVLGFRARSSSVNVRQVLIGIPRLGILVEPFHVRMSWC